MTSVSVIIPTYNPTDFLKEAVRSALGQSYPPTEILLIDDGSDSEHRQLVYQLREEYVQIRLVELERNRGVSNARNIGMANATGDFILFLDDDDRLDSEMIKRSLMEFKAHPETDVIISKGTVYPGDEPDHYYLSRKAYHDYHQRKYGDLPPADPNYFLVYSPIIHSMLFRKEALLKASFPEDLCYGEDRYMWMKLRSRGIRYRSVKWIGANYRIYRSTRKSPTLHDQKQFFQKLLRDDLLTSGYERGYALSFLFLLSVKGGDIADILKYGIRSMGRPDVLLRLIWKFLLLRS